MAKIQGTIVVDIENCKGCGVCVSVCPTKALALCGEVNGKGYNFSYLENPEACIGCAGCAIVCPDSVIEVYKQKIQ
ncbi:MAG: 4Fe-4S dicluster domain-containing protein [Mucinivorans sp.]